MDEEKVYTLKELEKKLTKKENRWAHEFIIDWNKARAARAAGYSENSCYEIGWENSTKPHIAQYVDFIKDDLEKESGITKLRNLQELAKVAYSSIAHLKDSWIELKEFDKLTEDQLSAIESTDTKTIVEKRFDPSKGEAVPMEVEYIKIKLHPKTPSIAEINKMMGYYEAEKIDIKSAPTIQVVNASTQFDGEGNPIKK